MTDELPVLARRNHGRNHSYTINGDKAPGVTTILNGGLPKPALVGWAAKTIAEYVADRLDQNDEHVTADKLITDLRQLATAKSKSFPDDLSRTKVAEILKGVHWEDRDQAANKGTQVHDLAEQLGRGQEVTVPDELTGHVDACLQFFEDWQPTDALLELVVGSAKHGYCGTLDIIATLADGQRWLLDYKTNRSGPFAETALQLAAYRYADVALIDGDTVPMPKVDRCGVVWLRADGYDLYPFKAGPEQFRQFLYVQQVAQFQKANEFRADPSGHVKGDAITVAEAIAEAEELAA